MSAGPGVVKNTERRVATTLWFVFAGRERNDADARDAYRTSLVLFFVIQSAFFELAYPWARRAGGGPRS